MGRRKRTQEELNRRRRDIVSGAARVFGEAGFHGVTMDMIASTAGCSTATLYTYFAGKDEIFDAIMQHLGEEILVLIEAPRPPGMDTLQSMYWLLQRLDEFAHRNRPLLLTYLVQTGVMGHRVAPVAEVHTAFIDYYREIFEAGQAAGELRPDVLALDLALAFDGMVASVAMHRLMVEQPDGTNLEMLVGLFLKGAGR